ncbi:MAG: hypothetical protein WB646_10305, partial [Steroidobacteraceae bacterium]
MKDKPLSFDTLIARDEIHSGPSPGVALMVDQGLRFFMAPVHVKLLGFREGFGLRDWQNEVARSGIIAEVRGTDPL